MIKKKKKMKKKTKNCPTMRKKMTKIQETKIISIRSLPQIQSSRKMNSARTHLKNKLETERRQKKSKSNFNQKKKSRELKEKFKSQKKRPKENLENLFKRLIYKFNLKSTVLNLKSLISLLYRTKDQREIRRRSSRNSKDFNAHFQPTNQTFPKNLLPKKKISSFLLEGRPER